MKGLSNTSAPSAGVIRIQLSKIVGQEDLQVRSSNLSEHHAHDLRQAIKRGSKMPPLLVWQESADDGKPSGRLVLLDGRHRLAALRSERPGLVEVAAEVPQGTRQEALLAAASKNTKASLTLTRWENTKTAWAASSPRARPASRFTWMARVSTAQDREAKAGQDGLQRQHRKAG